MLKNETVEITIVPANKRFFKEYQIGQTVTVPVSSLPSKSNIMLECICDNCNRNFQQRRSRDLSVCGHCRLKNKMKNNTYGANNAKYSIPNKTELKLYLAEGKAMAAWRFGVSISVINSWIKKLNIQVPSYHGRKFFKTNEDYNSALQSIKDEMNSCESLSELSRKTGIPRHIIRKLKKENSLELFTKFDSWEKSLSKIEENISFYVEENKTKTLKQIAEDHKLSIEQLKKAFKNKKIRVKTHSYNKSKGELECRDFIRSLGEECFSYSFEKTFEIDCFVQNKNFGVEYCGEFWHRYDPYKNNKKYHWNKYQYFHAKGIKIMTIFESEWKDTHKNKILQSMIRSRLNHSSIKKIGARQCEIKEISKKDAGNFHYSNHISGATTSSYDIGLYYDYELVSVLSFLKSRFNKKYEYEISRFCSKLNYNVSGGFSRLFSYFVKTYNPSSILTYADLRFGNGQVYAKNGLNFMGTTPPNYYYYDKSLGYLENRMKFQKNKLQILFPKEYDSKKTEYEIMSDAGYYCIYDCGNNRYEWINKKTVGN